MIKRYCDRCNLEIKRVIYKNIIVGFGVFGDEIRDSKEFCLQCADELDRIDKKLEKEYISQKIEAHKKFMEGCKK